MSDLVPPISSGCTADPFTADGSSCPSAAAGTPFFLFTDGAAGNQRLFARAYKPGVVKTNPPTAVTASGGTLHALVNPGGAVVKVSFQFGQTNAYGDTTTAVRIGPSVTGQSIAQAVSGIPSGATVHFRVSVQTDFGTFTGADQVFTTH